MGERQRDRSEREDTGVGERGYRCGRETGVFEREGIQMRERERETGM